MTKTDNPDHSEKGPDTPNLGEEGYALVAVLSFLVILSAILTPFVVSVRAHFQLSQNMIGEEKAFMGMKDALRVAAIMHASQAKGSLGWSKAEFGCTAQFDNQRQMYFRYTNHAGLIDLNAAGGDLLKSGFGALGFPPVEAEQLAELALDFRTAHARESPGASMVEELPVGGLKGALFESMAELTDFPGMGNTPLHKLSRVFTVQSRSGTLDKARASHPLQGAIRTNNRAIVQNSNREPALTVYLQSTDSYGATRFSYAVFGFHRSRSKPDDVLILEPPRTGYVQAEEDEIQHLSSSVARCSDYFNTAAIELFEEMLP